MTGEPLLPPPSGQPWSVPAPTPAPGPSAPRPSEPGPPTSARPRTGDRDWVRRLIIVLTLVNTILAAVVAGLEVDASTRADAANRDSERLAVVATGVLISVGDASSYETGFVADVLRLDQESLVLAYSALELQSEGDSAGAGELRDQQAVTQARADRSRELSTLYQDPRYAPSSPDQLPAVQDYVDTGYAAAQAVVDRQNAASSEYHSWDDRSSTYVAILSILAVAFFLLGVAQVSRRMRLFLALTASTLMAGSLAWTLAAATG